MEEISDKEKVFFGQSNYKEIDFVVVIPNLRHSFRTDISGKKR